MITFMLAKVALLWLPLPWVAHNYPLSPLSRILPTPYQLKAEMSRRQLKGLSELLEVTEQLRESFEKDNDPRCQAQAKRLREQEEEMKQQIAGLRRFLAAPPPAPVMPLYRPERPAPKPPIRD